MSKLNFPKFRLAVIALVAFTSMPAHAGAFFINATGLASPDSTVTFDELSLPAETQIASQYAPFGVTLNGAFLNVQDGFLPRNYVTNFSFSRGVQNPDLQITFGSLVGNAAFDLITIDGDTRINIFRGTTLVDSAITATNTPLP